MERFKSRKFILTLGVILTALGTALMDEVTWVMATETILYAVLAYLGIEGAADYKERKSGK